MKKYTLFLFVFVFVFTFFNININSVKANTASDCVISNTLRVGLRGEQVKCLQTSLGGLVVDGNFGPKTKSAVVAWQLKWEELAPDGIFGPKSRAVWVAQGGISGNFPEGCQSASGYSITTGLPCTVVPPSGFKSPVISGISGPQSLNVNQTGTWTVTAYDPKGGNLSYSVVWGDEGYVTGSSETPQFQQSATFTHNYAQAGRYAPKFTVTNDIVCFAYPCPNSASASLSVNVGGVISANNLSVNPASATIKVGGTATFQALLSTGCSAVSGTACLPPPPSAVNATWTSSNTSVATIKYKNACPAGAYCFVATDYLSAVVTGVSQGTATITANYTDSSGNALTANALVAVNVVSQTPTISSPIFPTSGAVGSQVTIHVSNFTATGNRIKFGDTNSENDPSYSFNSGMTTCTASIPGSCYSTITFSVPTTYYVACLHSNPACMIATRMIQPGVYPVSVINANGASNVAKFLVTTTTTTASTCGSRLDCPVTPASEYATRGVFNIGDTMNLAPDYQVRLERITSGPDGPACSYSGQVKCTSASGGASSPTLATGHFTLLRSGQAVRECLSPLAPQAKPWTNADSCSVYADGYVYYLVAGYYALRSTPTSPILDAGFFENARSLRTKINALSDCTVTLTPGCTGPTMCGYFCSDAEWNTARLTVGKSSPPFRTGGSSYTIRLNSFTPISSGGVTSLYTGSFSLVREDGVVTKSWTNERLSGNAFWLPGNEFRVVTSVVGSRVYFQLKRNGNAGCQAYPAACTPPAQISKCTSGAPDAGFHGFAGTFVQSRKLTVGSSYVLSNGVKVKLIAFAASATSKTATFEIERPTSPVQRFTQLVTLPSAAESCGDAFYGAGEKARVQAQVHVVSVDSTGVTTRVFSKPVLTCFEYPSDMETGTGFNYGAATSTYPVFEANVPVRVTGLSGSKYSVSIGGVTANLTLKECNEPISGVSLYLDNPVPNNPIVWFRAGHAVVR